MNKYVAIVVLALMVSLPVLHSASAEANSKVNAESLAEWLKKKKAQS